jgi:hypothetical protein
VYHSERLQCHSVKIQKSFGRESHAKTGSHPRGKKAIWRKDCEPVISSNEATGFNGSIVKPDPEFTAPHRNAEERDAVAVAASQPP